MDWIFLIGVVGALVLVIGAATPERREVLTYKSLKNWLLALGTVGTFSYALLDYLYGTGMIFFVLLQGMVLLASVLMIHPSKENVDTPILFTTGIALVLWSLWLGQDLWTLVFVLGLVGISLGYVFASGTARRQWALLLGSVAISVYSAHTGSMIFLWLNVFFAGFSLWYLLPFLFPRQKV